MFRIASTTIFYRLFCYWFHRQDFETRIMNRFIYAEHESVWYAKINHYADGFKSLNKCLRYGSKYLAATRRLGSTNKMSASAVKLSLIELGRSIYGDQSTDSSSVFSLNSGETNEWYLVQRAVANIWSQSHQRSISYFECWKRLWIFHFLPFCFAYRSFNLLAISYIKETMNSFPWLITYFLLNC